MPEKKLNRWLVVVGAVVIQFCLGAIYAWSVFTKKVTQPLGQGGAYGFSAQQAAWIFSAGLLTFAVVMVWAGRMQAKVGPRPIALAGGIVLGLGYILGGFWGHTFLPQLLCIGVVGGAGIGLAYVVPIAVGVKWFPDKKGLITGLAVAGFGFGATLWVKLAGSWFGGLLNTISLFEHSGVQSVFMVYGVVFLVLVLLGSTVMVNPPAGYRPEGWVPPVAGDKSKATGLVDFSSAEMARTPQFYMLWLMFFFSAMAGLMVISCIKLFGIDAQVAGPAKVDAKLAEQTAETAMALLAIANGLGRIIWGVVSDKIGRRTALLALCLLQGAVMLAFFELGQTGTGLIVGACIIGFNFGGNFALFPSATADFFGNKNVGLNYGWIFLSYGIAGVAGPQLAGYFKDLAKGDVAGWFMPFLITGIACLVAAVLALLLKVPKRPSSAAA